MKAFHFLLVAAVLSFSGITVHAAPAYTSTTGDAPFQWIDPSAGTAILSGNGSAAGTIDLEIPWGGIYGEEVSQLRVSRNGFLSSLIADSGTDDSNDCPLPKSPSSGGGFRIYVLHDDLEIDNTNGKIWYQYFPASPHTLYDCGVHVITWENVHHPSPDNTRFSFQALLFDNLDILYQYGDGNPEGGSGSTTGIQDSSAGAGHTVVCDTPSSIKGGIGILIQPETITVTTVADELDSPAGANVSLREALRDIVSGGRIEIDSSLSKQTIQLSAAEGGQGVGYSLSNKVVAVDGSSLADRLYVSGAGTTKLFSMANGSWLSLKSLHLERGTSQSLELSASSTVIATDSTIMDCFGSSIGPVFLTGDSSAAFYKCDFVANGGFNSGALFINGGIFRAEKCKFWRNKATLSGGALGLQSTKATLRFCDFALNQANQGAAIIVRGDVTLDVFGCTFDSNHADGDGGGIAFHPSSGATVNSSALLKYCTFFQNSSHDDGGAIYESTTGAFGTSLDIHHSTFYQNHARGEGGAFYLDDSKVNVRSIIMADNSADGSGDQVGVAPSGTGGLNPIINNVETGSEGSFSSNGGVSNVTDIGLTDLGHFGGCVRVCMPLQHSPVIDASALGVHGPTDARGFDPTRDGGAISAGADLPDVGAVEVGPTVTVTTESPSGAGSLQTAVNAAIDGGVVAFASGIKRISLTTDLSVPSGKTIFLDASSVPEVIIERLGFSLTNGQNFAMHGLRVIGSVGVDMQLVGGQLTTHRCHFSGYTLTTSSLFGLENAAASFLRTHFVETTYRAYLDGILFSEGRTAEFVLRDSLLRHLVPGSSAPSKASIVAVEGGLGILERNTLTDNHSLQGGVTSGIAVVKPSSKSIRTWGYLAHNTISQNRITRPGGGSSVTGVLVYRSIGNALISQTGVVGESNHNTIVNNVVTGTNAGKGLNVVQASSGYTKLRINGTIISGHGGDNVGVSSSTVVSGGGNLSDMAVSFFGASDVSSTDPLLSPLVMGPNRTLHHVPRPGSPCIDAIASVSTASIRDGRGFQRIFDGDGNGTAQLDIGAVEAGRTLMVTTAADESNGSLGLGAGDSLRECVDAVNTFGAVNIGFGPSLANQTLPRGTGTYIIDAGLVDIDGKDTGIMLEKTSGGALFSSQEDATLSMTGLTLDGLWASVGAIEKSTLSLNGCTLTGLGKTVGSSAQDDACLYMGNCQVQGNSVSGQILHATDNATLILDNSALYDNEGSTLIRVEDDARFYARATTFARNGFQTLAECSGQSFSTWCRSTITRNGGGVVLSNTAQLRFQGLIVANNFGLPFFSGVTSGAISRGNNLVDHNEPRFNDASDLQNRGGYLAPLIDADGDGVAEMPLLSASARFNQNSGSMDAPSEVLIVTTEMDENDIPAGASLSLREAIRDVADGGTIVFAPSLNNALIDMRSSSTELPRSLTIDATSLPLGIDLRARFYSNVAGNRIRLHGVHLRDNTIAGANGGALGMSSSKGTLAMSHCAVSNIDIGTGVNTLGAGVSLSGGVAFALENCTFSNNRAGKGSALHLTSGTDGRIEFCTFAEGRASDAAIGLGFSSTLEVYASSFFDNFLQDGTTESAAIEEIPSLALTSLGYNLFSTASAPAAVVSTDDVFANPGGSYSDPFEPFFGGWVDVYHAIPLSGLEDRTPVLGTGDVRPPEHDSRGYGRIARDSADYGALEWSASITDTDGDGLTDWWERLYGFDPNTADDVTQDHDGDQQVLRDEYTWRTDPFDDASFFDINHLTTTNMLTLGWNTVPGYDYQVDTSEDLSGWDPGPIYRAMSGYTNHEAATTGITPRLFYRVRRLGGLGWIVITP